MRPIKKLTLELGNARRKIFEKDYADILREEHILPLRIVSLARKVDTVITRQQKSKASHTPP